MLAVGLRAEVGVDVGNQVVQQHGIERCAVLAAPCRIAAATEGRLDVAALHDHNHRHGLALGNGIVHDVLHLALIHPTGLALAHAVLQVEHGVALLALLILGGGIDQGVAPDTCFVYTLGIVDGRVVDAAHTAVGDALLRTVVVALGTLRHLQTARFAVAAEEGLAGGIDEVHALDVHEVIVEAHGQRIGDCHEAVLAVGLHVILLAADIYDDFLGLGCMNAEVGAALLVHLGEGVAGDGGLGCDGILGHLNLFSLCNGHLGPFGLESELTGYGFAIAATQLAIAGGVEVQAVGAVGTVVGRDDLAGVDGLGQFVNLFLATDADALASGLDDVPHVEVHILGLQLQVAAQVVIDLLHHARPLGVARVGLALMHQDALDDAVLLCLSGELHQALVGVVVVGLEQAFHPARGFLLGILLYAVGQESLDVDAADGDMDDTHLDILGKGCHEGAAEPVGRREACVRTAEGSCGLAPFALLAGGALVSGGEIHCGHQQEARARAGQVGGFGFGGAFHVGLSEAEEDVEVLIDGCRHTGAGHAYQSHRQQARKDVAFHDVICIVSGFSGCGSSISRCRC